MATYRPELSTTFDEYLILPGLTRKDCTPETVSLRTPLVKHRKDEESGLSLNLPFASAIMQAVSGPETAIRLAREGGISFIFGSQSIANQAQMVAEVKNHKAGFVGSRANLTPDHTVGDIIALKERTGHSTIAVTHDGTPNGRLLGVVTGRDWRPGKTSLDMKVEDIMTPIGKLIIGAENLTLDQANDRIWEAKLNSLPIVGDQGELKHFVFRKDSENHKENPNEVTDNQKRLLVGAGINTRDYADRAAALLENGVDVLCIDSSDGHTEWQSDTIRYLKKTYGDGIKVGAGNVVTKEGFLYLVQAGADFVKIGIGGGSICITREEKGIGRGQATALREIVEARDAYFKSSGIYIPICSDGGIVYDRHMALALAMGADFLMMGRYFAQFDESPGKKIIVRGQPMKEYWGEGTHRARNGERYSEGSAVGSSRLKFEEGVEGRVPYAGPMSQGLISTVERIKSTMVSAGSKNLRDFTRDAQMTIVSPTSIKEAGTGNVTLA